MSGHRTVARLLAMVLGTIVINVVPGSPPAHAAADPGGSGSAVTVAGKGDFANLKVTVSQTNNLINQVVTVSWTGGTPTVSDTDFQIDYLQIMQCWGDDPAGPDRTQCQFGALGNDPVSAGTFVRSRQVGYDPPLIDPEESLTGQSGYVYVPFWPVGRPKPAAVSTSESNAFFDSQVTNEIPLARTHGDGTGEEFFEIETVRQAAGLGCGAPITTGGVTTGRSCWLVIVPRGTKEVDGSTRAGQNDFDRLQSSPLSQSNWDNRIVVPLAFLPVGQACPIGAPERPVIGHEMASDAVISWQPALCAGGGALFSYTQLPDDVSRTNVSSGGLAVVNNPIPPDQVPADHPVVYAPVVLSGLAIAFNIDRQPLPTAPAADLKLNGLPFESMKLTPRLVAKLLTQSYQGAVEGLPDYLANNPPGLLSDPEFLALNPEYKGLTRADRPVPDALVQLNGADVTSQLWSWVLADPKAKAFLTGTPDEFGMKVNPKNDNLALPTSTFPRNDQGCIDVTLGANVTGKVCTLDSHPYASDMHDAGRSISRGDSQARTPTTGSDLTTVTVAKVPRQPAGQRALLAVVDAATAIRYGLPTAQLLNAAGKYVAPTTDSLLAGEAAMKPSAVAGVLSPDPTAGNPAAYPLTALSYAVTSPSTLDVAAGKDYAAFLRYAGGPGQQPGIEPGQLPPGMVPLPDSLKAQTIAAASAIETQIRDNPSGLAAPLRAAATTRAGPRGVPGAAAGHGSAIISAPAPPPSAVAAAPAGSGVPAAKVPSEAQQPVAGVRRTPSLSAPAVGAFLAFLFVLGVVAAGLSPIPSLLNRGLARRSRKGVSPPER